MRVLGIESATSRQSVALVEDDRLVAEAFYLAEGTRGGGLMPTLDEVLRQAGVAPRDLGAVAVSVGPGSFTGLRVGLATAKGLALGTGAALVGVPTLEVLAEGYPVPDAIICAVLDAYRGEVYTALFRRCNGRLERLSVDAVQAPEALATTLGIVDGEAHLIGNGAARYRERLQAALGARAIMTEEGLRAVPSAAVVARLGLRKLGQLEGGERTGSEVVPVYVRRTEAEMNWDKGLVQSPLARVRR
jgi:tRNA threonylcarbamoyladenosine biosynthesis protein TsaB